MPLTLAPFVLETERGQYREAAELGRLRVPENRNCSQSRSIELAFLRFRGHGAASGAPVVFLAGGPGDSGIQAARREQFFPWFMALREIGDVILLDQRGAGRSQPALESLASWDLPLDCPGDRDQVLAAARRHAKNCRDFWRQQGVDLAGYTTEESADDLEDLRRALGVTRINLWGTSYGTHLGLTALRRHPKAFHRAVLANVEGPDHTIKRPAGVEAMLDTLAARVAADDKLRQLIPSFLDLMATVHRRLEKSPVTVTVSDPVTGKPAEVVVGAFDLRWLAAGGLGSVRFISKLPARYLAMAAGDFSWLAEQVLRRRRAWFTSAMALNMDCASGLSNARADQIRLEAPGSLLGGLVDFPFPEVCAGLGCPDLGDHFRSPVQSDVETLFISGSLDGRTPAANAEEVISGFANGRHLLVDGAAHNVLGISAELERLMIDFLHTGAVGRNNLKVPFQLVPPPV